MQWEHTGRTHSGDIQWERAVVGTQWGHTVVGHTVVDIQWGHTEVKDRTRTQRANTHETTEAPRPAAIRQHKVSDINRQGARESRTPIHTHRSTEEEHPSSPSPRRCEDNASSAHRRQTHAAHDEERYTGTHRDAQGHKCKQQNRQETEIYRRGCMATTATEQQSKYKATRSTHGFSQRRSIANGAQSVLNGDPQRRKIRFRGGCPHATWTQKMHSNDNM